MNASSLQLFGPEIWLADGPEVEVIGFRCPTRMAVIRLSGGGLFIWSPVALSDALRKDLSDLRIAPVVDEPVSSWVRRPQSS